MLDNRGIEFYGVVRGARWLISAQSSAPNHAFQTRNSSDRLARAGGAVLSILPRTFLMRQCACRQPVCLFFFCRGHVCSCVLGLPPMLSTQPLFQTVGWPRPPYPIGGSLWVRACNFPSPPCPLAFNGLLPHRHALIPVKIRAPSPLQCSRWASPQRRISFHCWSRVVARQGCHFRLFHASSHGLCV